MKKLPSFLLTLVTLSLLTACGSASSTPQSTAQQLYAFKTFSLAVPDDWRKISKEDFSNTIPEETAAIFLKKIDGSDFIQNANVVKESLNTDATGLEYAKANLLLGSKAITDYRPSSSQEIDVGGIKTVLHLFQARSASAEPLLNYSQTYFAQDRLGYTVTCISKPDDAVQLQICDSIVKSFRFVKS